MVDFATGVAQSLWLFGILLLLHDLEGILLLLEFLSADDVALGHHAHLIQHVGQFLILQVEEVLVVHHRIEVVLVLFELGDTIVHEFVIVVEVHFVGRLFKSNLKFKIIFIIIQKLKYLYTLQYK